MLFRAIRGCSLVCYQAQPSRPTLISQQRISVVVCFVFVFILRNVHVELRCALVSHTTAAPLLHASAALFPLSVPPPATRLSNHQSAQLANHPGDGLHVRCTLHVILVGQLAIPVPASTRNLFAVASDSRPFVARLGCVVPTFPFSVLSVFCIGIHLYIEGS